MMENKRRDISLIRVFRKLYPMVFRACPILFISCNVLGIVHGISFGLITFVSQRFFDSVTNAISSSLGVSAVLIPAMILGLVVIGSQVLNGIHNFMATTFFNKMGGFLGMEINRQAAHIDPIYYESSETLDDINKASAGANNSMFLLFTATNIFTFYLPFFIFMGIYLFTLKPLLSISLILVFIPVVSTQLIRSAVFAKLEDQVAPIRRQYEYYERCICDREYFKETRILGAFNFFNVLYKDALNILGKRTWEAEKRVDLLEFGMKLITLSGYFGILYLLFSSLMAGDISVGAFAAVFASVGGLFDIMEEIVCRHIGHLTKDLGTVKNFMSFLDLPKRVGRDLEIDGGQGLNIKDISFRYPGAKENALTEVSFTIGAGETIALVGENGAGKTTLVKLMIGLYRPTEGSVEIGGIDIEEASSKSLYRGISAVFQKYQRYKMTLGENIHIGNLEPSEVLGDIDRAKLDDASFKADLDIDSPSLPEGYDTMLAREFDGVDLSGGQWQRVAIARGFYRAHNMIVLDEPTASIDPIEETKVYKKFAEISRGKTSIIVTHRLGAAKIADRIILMDGGKILEIGTHEELMDLDGRYAKMYDAQAGWYVS